MRLPSTRSLEAMVSVARHGSLAAAGAELGMSVPALSRRIALLEQDLGMRLFDRLPRGVALTPAGAAYHAEVAPTLDRLRGATAKVLRAGRDTVRVTTIPAFATRWLLPRLPRFSAAHPGIEVDVRTSISLHDLEAQDFDLAIRLALRGDVDGDPLLPIHLLPVWSPSSLGEMLHPAELDGHALLGPDHRPEFWAEWFGAYGSASQAMRVREIDALLLYELTMAGAGVAIGIEPLVTPLLDQGRLNGMAGHRVRSARGFHLLLRLGRPSHAAKLFRDWLQREAEGSVRAVQL